MKTVQQVIEGSLVEGNVLKLESGLDYAKEFMPARNQLQLLGGTWDAKIQAFRFASDPNPIVAEYLGKEREVIHKKWASEGASPKIDKEPTREVTNNLPLY